MTSNKKISDYVYDLITTYHYKDYEDLAEDEKSTIAGMLLDSAGQFGFEAIVDANDSDMVLHSIKSYLDIQSKEEAIHLGQNIKDCIIHYYEKTMKQIFNTIYETTLEVDYAN